MDKTYQLTHIRIPLKLHADIVARAKRNNTSMNREIVDCLQKNATVEEAVAACLERMTDAAVQE
jgi:predicted HicB family RNase H-like nuclease